MRKNLLFIAVLIFGASFLSSCNDKLKDDMEALEKEIAELKDQQNQTNAILGANEPVSATTKFTDDDGNERIISAIYKFKANDNSTQKMYDNGDGTYYIFIERFGDVEANEGASIEFNYDPTSKTISDQYVRHYWDINGPYNNYSYFAYHRTGTEIEITLNSINVSTGAISLNVTATEDEQYSYDYYYDVPNEGSPVSTTLSFSGKLKLFPYEEENMVERKGAK